MLNILDDLIPVLGIEYLLIYGNQYKSGAILLVDNLIAIKLLIIGHSQQAVQGSLVIRNVFKDWHYSKLFVLGVFDQLFK